MMEDQSYFLEAFSLACYYTTATAYRHDDKTIPDGYRVGEADVKEIAFPSQQKRFLG